MSYRKMNLGAAPVEDYDRKIYSTTTTIVTPAINSPDLEVPSVNVKPTIRTNEIIINDDRTTYPIETASPLEDKLLYQMPIENLRLYFVRSDGSIIDNEYYREYVRRSGSDIKNVPKLYGEFIKTGEVLETPASLDLSTVGGGSKAVLIGAGIAGIIALGLLSSGRKD